MNEIWFAIKNWTDVFLLLSIFAAFFVAMIAWGKALRAKQK